MKPPEVFFVAAVRTAIGSFGGALKDSPLAGLATLVVGEALRRSAADPESIGQVVMGNVIPTEPADAYLARVAAIGSGLPRTSGAFNVNRLCGSGLQAIVSAAQYLMLGDAELVIGGGAESMSRAPYLAPSARWGARMGDTALQDYMLGILHDPFQHMHMGVTAENVATEAGITRDEQDALAIESQLRAARAIDEGRFVTQIVPVPLKGRKGPTTFAVDEHVRRDATQEQLARMKPVFKEGGTVTAGNSSGLNDGAAAVVLATGDAVRAQRLAPMARLVGYAHAGVEPSLMGLGPVPASRKVLQRTGLALDQMDVIESNEAFAAQACAVSREMGFNPARVNPNGSGISLGHPVGATGAILVTKAIHEHQRTGGRYALVTMCIGGGQGIAAILERS